MGAALRLVDEQPNGTVVRELVLELASEKTTAREIIERRVRHEVARFNSELGDVFHGLVQPTDTEALLNGYRLRTKRRIDADEQCKLACRAFESNGFFMLADDHQIESLDDEVIVTPGSKVSFVKLVPLVGG
jgi:hypothetical protein